MQAIKQNENHVSKYEKMFFFFCSAKIDNYIICREPGVLKIHMCISYKITR